MPGPGFGYGYGAVGNARRAPLISGAGTPTPTPAPALPALANIVGHFDAAQIAPQTDGTALAQWNDVSGSGAHAAQATAGSRPTYRTGGAGGQPYVAFDGVDDGFTIATPGALLTAMDSATYTLLAVVENVADGAGGFGNIFGATNGSASPWLWATATTMGWSSSSNGGALVPNISGGGYMTLGIASAVNSGHGGSSAGQLIRHVYRGAIYGSNTRPATTPSSRGVGLAIGSRSDGTSFRFKGRIYRIIVWNRLLTPAELMQAEACFNHAYAQTHPAVALGRFLHLDGDSRMAGVGSGGSSVVADVAILPYKVASGLGFPLGTFSAHAIGGLTIQNCINKGGELDDLSQAVAALSPTIQQRLIYEEFFNSRTLSVGTTATAGTMAYQTKQYLDARRAGMPANLKIIGQSPCDHANVNNPQPGAWASYMQANWAALGLDALADVWASSLGGDNACPNSAPWAPWSDGLHLDASGQAIQAGVIVAACEALAGW